MTKMRRVYGRRKFLFLRSRYDYGPIEIDDEANLMVHVFVAPQDLKGLEIARMDPTEEQHGTVNSHTVVGGDVMIGNPKDGYYNVPFEIWHKDGTVVRCLMGDDEFQLDRGSVFVIGSGYSVSQLDCHSFEEAMTNL